MTNSKHTPGPWYVPDRRDSFVESVNEDTGYKICIADCGTSYVLDESEMYANARLIASAPELLEELKHTARNLQSMVNFFPTDRAHAQEIEYRILVAWLERTNIAIQKAEGKQ